MKSASTAKELILRYGLLLKDDPKHENLTALLEMAYAKGHAEGIQRAKELHDEVFARVTA